MIYVTEPEKFTSKFDVVGSFCEFEDKILLLHREDALPQGNLWGLPSGKVDEGETVKQAVQREVREETGVSFPVSAFSQIQTVFVRYPDYDFIYHMFSVPFSSARNIRLNPGEHKEFQWLTPKEVLRIENGIEDLDRCVEVYLSKKMRPISLLS